ncbi:MAG: hypothetical protein KDI98_05830 [Hyphomicrobiaceae bacterium]|nr:hypothetical protein [Hyphomicrobiaceae bacterium]
MFRILIASIALLFSMGLCQAASIHWELRYPYRVMAPASGNSTGQWFRDFVTAGPWDWSARRALYYDPDCDRSDIGAILCSERAIGPVRRERAAEALRHPSAEDREALYGAAFNYINFPTEYIATAYLRTDSFYDHARNMYYNDRHHERHDHCGANVEFIQALTTDDSYISDECATKGSDFERRPSRIWLEFTDQDEQGQYSEYMCTWNVDGAPITSPCGEPVSFGMLRGDSTSTIRVTIADPNDSNNRIAPLTLSGEDTLIRELVILSMGDSYSAGEGAPDFAARTRLRNGTFERIPTQGIAPNRDDDTPREYTTNAAHWLERSCHRSFLSAPSRAAIHYAATNPQTEVVHINLTCSGAEVYSGILGTYSGVPEFSRNRNVQNKTGLLWRATLSQINQAILLLCRDPDVDSYIEGFNAYMEQNNPYPSTWQRVLNLFGRSQTILDYYEKNGLLPDAPWDARTIQEAQTYSNMQIIECRGTDDTRFIRNIDVLTMTIGGNDTGFASVIMDALVSDVERVGLNWARERPALSPSEARVIVNERIESLYGDLNDAIRHHLPVHAENIIVSTYPLGFNDENNIPCDDTVGLASFDLISLFGIDPVITGDEIKDINDNYASNLNLEIQQYALRNEWNVISADTLFDRHGWCAGEQGIISSDRRDTPGPYRDAYAVTERWLRTPDDGTAVQNQLPTNMPDTFEARSFLGNLTETRLLTTFGLFHPNGLGYAAWADLYFCRIDAMVNPDTPDDKRAPYCVAPATRDRFRDPISN